MHNKLKKHQKQCIDRIIDFYYSKNKKGRIYLSTGTGKSAILLGVAEKLLQEKKHIIILTASLTEKEQLVNLIFSNIKEIRLSDEIKDSSDYDIMVLNNQRVINNKLTVAADTLVILSSGNFVNSQNIIFKNIIGEYKIIGFLNIKPSSGDYFDDAATIFEYSIQDAYNDGFINGISEVEFIHCFVAPLLISKGYKNLQFEYLIDKSRTRADVFSEKENKKYIFEVKYYRAINNSRAHLNDAVKQMIRYQWYLEESDKEKNYMYTLIMCCKIDSEIRKEVYDRYNIEIWDISNILYLVQGNNNLYELLLKYVPYPISDILPEETVKSNVQRTVVNSVSDASKQSEFEKRLSICKPGRVKKAEKEYEKICTDIIEYLFKEEFLREETESRTGDSMFRMDLLCSLKGTTSFWKFLMDYFNTKFVVFEYKNYAQKIKQNLIYITEKYLFPVALRNVAFIISRRGFDDNARKAALVR